MKISEEKELLDLLNSDFSSKAIWIMLTYKQSHLPVNFKQAEENVQNYTDRLKDYMRKNGMGEFKHICKTKYQEAEKKRVHHHIICDFPNRDVLEESWNDNGRTLTRRLSNGISDFEEIVRYILKN